MQGGGARLPAKPRPVRGFAVSGERDCFAAARPRRFRALKWTIYALLAVNVWLYARHGRATELVDTAAWLVLLMLFEWETGGWHVARAARPLIHGLRVTASIAVAIACIGYAMEREWLDFANEMTWLAVVALLELELRVPADRQAMHYVRRVLAATCYLALLVFLVCWLAEGARGEALPMPALLDAWDALLWLVAFGAIELNVVRASRGAAFALARAAA